MGRHVETAEKQITSRQHAGASIVEGVQSIKKNKKQWLKITLTW